MFASDEFSDFLDVLEETTQIATKNKVNADYAPGIITILKSEDLKRMGIKDFYEALRLIPSIDIKISPTGTKNIVTRGIGGITGSGKTKIMINGVGQNSNASGIIHFNLPMETIDRIEVIRGPASALYGEYAFNGTINIITKKDQNSIFYLNSSNGYLSGAVVNYKQDDLNINAIISKTEDKGIEVTATDSIATRKQIETLRNDQNFIANIVYKDFTANIALNKAKKGEFYGISSLLPTADDKENFVYDYKTIEMSNKFNITNNFSIEPKVGFLKYDYFMDITKMAAPIIVDANIVYIKKYFMLDGYYNYNNHTIITGIEKSKTDETKSASSSTNKITNITTPTIKSNNNYSVRTVDSVYLQDNIAVTNKLDLNLGIRYENYNDKFNTKLTNSTLPRIASVYRIDDSNILKLQYAKAYRPPTFLEGIRVEPEIINTYELQYIYKKNNQQFQGTIFHSIVKKLIINTAGSIYINKNEDIVSEGVELEYLYDFNNEYLLNSNISYNNVYEKDTKQNLENYSKVLANLSLSYLPYSRFSSTLFVRYVGSQDRIATDTRNNLKAQYTADISFKYLPYKIKNNMEVLFGIKNITDVNVKSPSSINTIENDLVYSQREYFIGITYKF